MGPKETNQERFLRKQNLTLDDKIRSASVLLGRSMARKLTGINIYTFRDLALSGLQRGDLVAINGINNKGLFKMFKLLKSLVKKER